MRRFPLAVVGFTLGSILLGGVLSQDLAAQQPKAETKKSATSSPSYPDRVDLTYYIDSQGNRKPITDRDGWLIRRQHVLQRMQQVMGPVPAKEKRVPLDVKVLSEESKDGVLRRKIEYTPEPGDRVRAWLMIPTAVAKDARLPAVLCLHQTNGALGKDEPAGIGGKPNLHYAIELAKRGFVTLTPDYPSFGEHPFDFKAPKFGWKSGTMKAIWDNVRAVDLLQAMTEVDPERIGCIGHSLGGHNTMFTAAFDDRIKAMVSCCGFTRFHKYYGGALKGWTSDRYMPAINDVYHNSPDEVPFDFPEIVAVFAPRAFLAVAPKRDENFEVSGVIDSLAQAKKIYELYDAADKLVGDYPDAEHDFPPDSREQAYHFLEKQLGR